MTGLGHRVKVKAKVESGATRIGAHLPDALLVAACVSRHGVRVAHLHMGKTHSKGLHQGLISG